MIKENMKPVKKSERVGAHVKFPSSVLGPVKRFLQGEERRLLRRKIDLTKLDPFKNVSRVDDNAAEDTDAAEQVGHAQVSALKRQLDRRLIQVRKALTRLKFGHYGNCEKCHNMIDTERLMVKPEATTCVKCELKQEG